MSVDVTAYSMYGKEFDSFGEALDFLLERKLISEEDYDNSQDSGELEGLCNISWQLYSHYTGGEGVLGVELSWKRAYNGTQDVPRLKAVVDEMMDGAKFYEFCQWH